MHYLEACIESFVKIQDCTLRLEIIVVDDKSTDETGDCDAALAIKESGIQPDPWLLLCPSCGTSVGSNIDKVSATPIVRRWESEAVQKILLGKIIGKILR